jgi:hypothetical protein
MQQHLKDEGRKSAGRPKRRWKQVNAT